MQQNIFTLPAMPEMRFSVTRTALDARSSLNQNEAHIHPECEVYINLSGNVAFAVEDRLYDVKRGSVIITMPYEYHHCIYRSNKLHEHYWITFSAEQDQDFLKLFFDREKGINNRIDLNEEQLSALCVALDGLGDGADGLDRRISILQFFRILMEGSRSGPAEKLDRLPGDVSVVMIYMDRNLTQELDIGALAQAGNVSINTLERHFKDSLGITPMVMLRNKRLFKSMMYLKSGSSVTEAAAKSGFSDYSNYIQLFRKQFGMTPGRYKKYLNKIG